MCGAVHFFWQTRGTSASQAIQRNKQTLFQVVPLHSRKDHNLRAFGKGTAHAYQKTLLTKQKKSPVHGAGGSSVETPNVVLPLPLQLYPQPSELEKEQAPQR